MLLFKGHPESIGKTKRVYKAIPLTKKQEIIEGLRQGMHGYKGYKMRGREITGLFMDAVHIDAMLTLMNYKRILVVTSYEDSKYSGLTDAQFYPISHAGDHMLPLVHHYNNNDSKVYVTKVKNGESMYSQLYDKFDISSVNVDSYYTLGSEFKTKTTVKFDAVVLLGTEAQQMGKYQVNDIKKVFAPYCKEEFDLIDIYRGEARTLRGLKKEKDLMQHRHGYKGVVGLTGWDFSDTLYVRGADNLAWSNYMSIY